MNSASSGSYPFLGGLGDATTQYGPVVPGPDQARIKAEASAPTSNLVRLSPRESANVQNAKRFAMEQSLRVALANRAHSMPFTVNLPGAAYSSKSFVTLRNYSPFLVFRIATFSTMISLNNHLKAKVITLYQFRFNC